MLRKKMVAMSMTFVALVIWLSWDNSVPLYISAVKDGAVYPQAAFGTAGKADDELMNRIREEASARRIAPVEPRLDRVWKLIPGYNGVEVDIERTYTLNQQTWSGGELQFVYREVEPGVRLEDLGAHPIYKGNPLKPMVALMVNVAWGNEYIDPILKVLSDEDVKATFFLDGSWLSKNTDIAKKIQSAGHEMSNHAYSHPNMSQLDRAAALSQITRTEKLLQEQLGVRNRWFAPPSGDYNQQTVDIAAGEGLGTVLWTLDTVDWKKPAPEWIVRKISLRLEPGAMILMHPTASSSEALPGMIAAIKSKRLEMGTVSELLSTKRVGAVEQAS
ncbi:polysaccharide deacetylase family protein [Paenibacillus sp. 1P07SE]|uniref:polysaccharide deacetylase family protein n=1 Tax=Paenibacillus sp. 1P07SE TaxID=3132209 RepID=UPI0039A60585